MPRPCAHGFAATAVANACNCLVVKTLLGVEYSNSIFTDTATPPDDDGSSPPDVAKVGHHASGDSRCGCSGGTLDAFEGRVGQLGRVVSIRTSTDPDLFAVWYLQLGKGPLFGSPSEGTFRHSNTQNLFEHRRRDEPAGVELAQCP